jgi:hypothetical protein
LSVSFLACFQVVSNISQLSIVFPFLIPICFLQAYTWTFLNGKLTWKSLSPCKISVYPLTTFVVHFISLQNTLERKRGGIQRSKYVETFLCYFFLSHGFFSKCLCTINKNNDLIIVISFEANWKSKGLNWAKCVLLWFSGLYPMVAMGHDNLATT